MLLKSADDKESQIAILKNLLNHDKVPAAKKQQIEKELRDLTIGVASEKQAAYEIDFYFAPSKNIAVIHDLRLEINGRVAQIDHLLIGRMLEVYVLETKTFSTGITINEHGEFSLPYEGKEIGIPSPIEQNNRHIRVLEDAFKEIGHPTRLGIPMPPSFRSVVLVSPKATIKRPKTSKIDLESIVKSDSFFTWYMKEMDKLKPSDVLLAMKIISANTVRDLAEKLTALHKPGRIDYVKKFDLAGALLGNHPVVEQPATPEYFKKADSGEGKRNAYYCFACKITIPDVVADYCWKNKPRFGGRTYCRPCQTKFQRG